MHAGLLALVAWISCRPYFTWPHYRAWMVACGLLPLVVLLHPGVRSRLRELPRAEALALAGLITFLVLATALPQVAGGHVAWIYAAPFAAALLLLAPQARVAALRGFALLVGLSLLPGLLWFAVLLAGAPVSVDTMPVPNASFADAGVRLLRFPGAVFIESNSVPLPWGGVLTRLCGMFDEPGRAGTVAALALAAEGYDFRRLTSRILFLAGLCSFSLAFVVLCAIGLAVNVGVLRRYALAGPLLLLVPVAVLATGVVRVPAPRKPVTALTIRGDSRPPGFAELRQTRRLDNRAMPEMKNLFAAYLAAPWRQRLLGLGSDASWVHSPASASWTSWLTNFGATGFALLALVFAGYGSWALARSGWMVPAAVFLGSFLLSAYQHPAIWVPYELLLYFGGLAGLALVDPTAGE